MKKQSNDHFNLTIIQYNIYEMKPIFAMLFSNMLCVFNLVCPLSFQAAGDSISINEM